MANSAETFQSNVNRYFEGPDPRTRGIGTIVGGLDHRQYRDYGEFQVYNYQDGSGVRPGSAVKDGFVGIGEPISRSKSLILLARNTDSRLLRSWVYYDLGNGSGVGFENILDETQTEAAVEYSKNPVLFDETSIFSGITEAQQDKLDALRRKRTELEEAFQSELNAIRDAERAAAEGARSYYLR